MKYRGVLYSTSCIYAVRATIFLARNPDGAPCDRIAHECGLAPCFLASVMTTLTKHGIVSSAKGWNGGYCLARASSGIRLCDLVAAIDGPTPRHAGCGMRPSPCNPETPCALHAQWDEVRSEIDAYFCRTTIGELVAGAEKLMSARASVSAE